ncbi:flagella synthesis protein FlgN [Marinobacterium arenosum]|uniref:flagella synthesis protein FlgN n=1 Tax=Marinobacterium arenosum TaxID=2862496 RepID=UPI001C951364|nr:flagellar protein FlgN [Marinobacterium arenosum]MBY4675913.1 flagellar protein FlgN [Marinobacterium arenosum]
MPNRFQNLTELPALLRQGCSYLQQLSDLLDRERDVLTKPDNAELERIMADKQTLLGQFDPCKQQWSQLISSHAASIDDFFTLLPDALKQHLLPLWQELERLNQQVKQANQRNGQIANGRQRQLGQLLSLMQGQRKQDQLYTDGGNSNNYRAQNRLGKA